MKKVFAVIAFAFIINIGFVNAEEPKKSKEDNKYCVVPENSAETMVFKSGSLVDEKKKDEKTKSKTTKDTKKKSGGCCSDKSKDACDDNSKKEELKTDDKK